jgi:hypothetical protein
MSKVQVLSRNTTCLDSCRAVRGRRQHGNERETPLEQALVRGSNAMHLWACIHPFMYEKRPWSKLWYLAETPCIYGRASTSNHGKRPFAPWIFINENPLFRPLFFMRASSQRVHKRPLQIARQDSQTDSERQLFSTDIQLTAAEGISGWKAPPTTGAQGRFCVLRIYVHRFWESAGP